MNTNQINLREELAAEERGFVQIDPAFFRVPSCSFVGGFGVVIGKSAPLGRPLRGEGA
jgi:hypothetical protein